MNNDLNNRLRDAVQQLRRTSMPVREVVPMLQQAADRIAELEARTPAAPVVAEGLTPERIEAVWNSLDGLAIIAGENQLNWNKKVREAFAHALLATHPVAGSPAEDDEGAAYDVESTSAVWARDYAAEPMPATEDEVRESLAMYFDSMHSHVLFYSREVASLIREGKSAEPMPASEAARNMDWYAELDRKLARWSLAAEDGVFNYEAIRDEIVDFCAAPAAPTDAKP